MSRVSPLFNIILNNNVIYYTCRNRSTTLSPLNDRYATSGVKIQTANTITADTISGIIQATELKKFYGAEPNITKALDRVTLFIEKGEFVAIVGTSGSGKSTLLNMMGGLDNPTSGSIKVKDKELSKMKDEQLTIFRRRAQHRIC